MPYSLWWPSFQSILMPFDFEMAMCSGSVWGSMTSAAGASIIAAASMQQPFYVAHAGDAAHGGHQLFELLLVAHVHGHFHQRAIVIEVGLGFEAADIGAFVEERGSKLVQHAGPIVRMHGDAHWKRIFPGARPVHFDFALGVVHQILHVGAHLRMHGHAL